MRYPPPAGASVRDLQLGISAEPGPARSYRCALCSGYFELLEQVQEHLWVAHNIGDRSEAKSEVEGVFREYRTALQLGAEENVEHLSYPDNRAEATILNLQKQLGS